MKKEYYILSPANFRLDGGAMYGIIPKPLWQKKSIPDDLNRIDLSLRLVLIKYHKKIFLIDSGIGDYHGEEFDSRFDVRGPKGPIQECLKKHGLGPEDITDLVLTHLHFDHVGGICHLVGQNLTPIFKNATIHLHRDHYQYSLNPTKRDSGSFHYKNYGPILDWYNHQGKINWLKGDEGDIDQINGLKFLTSHGHTPFLIHPYDDHFIYLADLIPTSNHIHIPWVMGYDISPGVTTEDKERVLSFAHKKNLTIIFEHDPLYWGSQIHQDESGRYISKSLKQAPIENICKISFD